MGLWVRYKPQDCNVTLNYGKCFTVISKPVIVVIIGDGDNITNSATYSVVSTLWYELNN